MTPLFRAFSVSLLLCVGAVSITGCDQLFQKEQVKKKPKKKAKKAETAKQSFTANGYVKDVGLALLSLRAGGDADEYLEAIQGYCAKKSEESENVVIAVLEYRDRNAGAMRKVAAPVSARAADQKALGAFMSRLDAEGTLNDIRITSTTVAPGCTTPEEGGDVAGFIDAQEKAILDGAQPLEVTEEVKMQLGLIGYFTDQRHRDAAYLMVDNVKRTLAKLSQGDGGNDPTVRSLSRQLETQEERLRKEIPFTL